MKNNVKYKNNPKQILLLIMIMAISIIGVINSFNIPKGVTKNNLYTYNIDKSVDYKVYLYDNNFITSDYMDMDKTYITELVDYIEADLNYNYKGTKIANVDYIYDIIATIYIDYPNVSSGKNSHLWSKDYELVKNKINSTEKTNSININEKVVIDYSEYNQEVTKFRESFDLPINSYLEVKFVIKTDANIGEEIKTISETSTITLNMNLNQQVFTIANKETGNDKNTLFETGETVETINKPLMIASSSALLIALMIFVNKIRKYIVLNRKTEYELQLSKILKNYGDIVAEIVNPIETSYMKIIDVKNFDQLLDIEEEIRMPILFCETKKGQEGLFTIIHDNIVYRYVLRERKRNRLY